MLAVTKKQIKEVSLKYCQDTLKNNEPEEEYMGKINDKKERLEKFLNEEEGDFEASREVFDGKIEKFKKSGKRNYDFLTRSGKKFQNAVYKFCLKMFKDETFPSEFQDTTLHMIFKGGKGRKENLSDNRFIHSKPWFPRLVEGLVVEGGLRKPLVEKSSIFQIGGQPKHQSGELVFAMKSIIAKHMAERKMVIIQCYDISKFFDKERIEDAILTCLKRKADPKAVRLWYKMNEKTRIQVKTGAGLSDWGEVGAVLGQGTLGGALISQAVLDEGVSEHFVPGGEGELEYGDVAIAPFMFQDDLIHGAKSIEDARKANAKVNIIMKERGLELNKDKSVCIVMGTKKQRMEAKEELRQKPLMCGDFETKEKENDKWLGQYLSGKSLADSVHTTVAAREGKIRGACLEIAHIVNDWRAEVVGGMETALMLWEKCIIPSLLHGAGNWLDISRATIKQLNTIQRWFLKIILQIGQGVPLAALTWESGLMDMELRVWQEKIILVLQIRSLNKETLARKIYEEQKKNNWPGLIKETKEICKALDIEDVNETMQNAKDYRNLVKLALKAKDKTINEELAKDKEKCKKIMKDGYGKKEYFTNKKIKDVREMFQTRTGMLPFAGNYSKDKRFSKTDWRCRCNNKIEDEKHILEECHLYKDIREKYESQLEEDEKLKDFFKDILKRRDEIDEKAKETEANVAASAAVI